MSENEKTESDACKGEECLVQHRSRGCRGSQNQRKARILPDMSFSVPAKKCAVCETLVIDTGLTPLCSKECVAEWAKRDRPPLSKEEKVLADRMAKDIEVSLRELIASKGSLSKDDAIQATSEVVNEILIERTEKVIANMVTVHGTVKV